MPRTREFDEEEALGRALTLFWEKGFADTSMRDLAKHTGVANAGLYQAFGDKAQLYAAALRQYARTQNHAFFGPLESRHAGRAELEAFFKSILGAARDGSFCNGCFIANTAVEFGEDGGVITEMVGQNMRRHGKAFRNALRNAQSHGEIAEDVDPKTLGASLAASFYGLSAMVRSRAPVAMIADVVDATLKQLG
ncbi:MAG: TetR/AcrR family transcriptional regulator [Pseudomonadota bacterium]